MTYVPGGASAVDSVNSQTGAVVLDADDISDSATTQKFTDAGDIAKLAGVEAGADVTDAANVAAAGALMDSEVDENIKTLALPANTTISAFGATLVDDADAGTARTTLGVDAAGADNSTDVTLAGTPDYITIAGQVITLGQVDLAADVTGDLPVGNLAGGSGASATTFWRGDGTWATPAGGGGSGPYLSVSYVNDETSIIDTNQPAASRFFLNTHRYVRLVDLADFTQVRLLVNKQGVAGAASAVLEVMYRAAGFSTAIGNYSQIGTSAVSVAINTTNTILNSGWIDLTALAIADDVAVCVRSVNGDGVLDPQFGYVELQFR